MSGWNAGRRVIHLAKSAKQHKPGTIGQRHTAPQRAIDHRRGSSRDRGYTAEWDRFSLAFLAANPLCEYCAAMGRTIAATVTDHDLPHRGDPELFWNNTFSALCAPCHNGTKARLETRYSGDALLRQVARAKAGLSVRRQSAGAIASAGAMLVWGPPSGGKTTWAKAEAERTGAIVYDLDDIAEGMGLPRYGRTLSQAKQAMGRMMDLLPQHPAHRRLILIAAAPEPAKRKRWASMIDASAARLVSATHAECLARAMADPSRARHVAQQAEIIAAWFRRAS